MTSISVQNVKILRASFNIIMLGIMAVPPTYTIVMKSILAEPSDQSQVLRITVFTLDAAACGPESETDNTEIALGRS